MILQRSLKQYYPLRIKLRPPFFSTVDTKNLYSQSITSDNAPLRVYIVSDFSCVNCQKAEVELQKLYKKYNNEVNFEFVFFSSYISKATIACGAADRQGKFRLMHDKIFDNLEVLDQDSVYYRFAQDLGIDIEKFSKDMNDGEILRKIMGNKNYLIENNIVSTPTFIINNKILDHKYSIHYLEDMINDELAKR